MKPSRPAPARPPLRRLAAATAASLLAATGLVATALPAAAATAFPTDILNQLVVAPESNSPAYDRDRFEEGIDADRDGCSTRREVLIAESSPAATVSGNCVVRGQWVSAYDGVTTTDANALEVDHAVALAQAWRSGARSWNDDQRRAYANDLDFGPTLIAVTSASNQAKADKDFARWRPTAAAAVCRFAIEQVQIKYRWNLTVDAAERDALAAFLPTCGSGQVEVPVKADVPAPTGSPAPTPTPSPTPSPSTTPTQAPAPAPSDRLTGGQSLAGGQWLLSPDRSHGLTLQADGNLVAYGPRYRVLWSSGTYGNPGARLDLQGDGNAVVYSAGGRVLWTSATYGGGTTTLRVQDDGNVVIQRSNGSAAFSTGWDRTGLNPGEALPVGQQVTSANGRYFLVLQADGNAVVYTSSGRPLFFTGSYGASRLQLQGDGNLVAYNGSGYALWDSGTYGNARVRLALQDDGNLVVYRRDGSPAWYSGWDTGQRASSPSGGTRLG